MKCGYSLAVLSAAALFGQATLAPRPTRSSPEQGVSERRPETHIRVDSNLVLIPATVLDPVGHLITGLEAEDFQILEDGVPQTITSFGNEDSPLSLGIVLDTSGSMGGDIAVSKKAVAEFFKSANPEDEAFLVQFSSRTELTVPFTHELGDVEDKILFSRAGGMTALVDAVTLAIAEMRKAKNPRKAIILLSDGGENNSRYTPLDVRRRLKESDVQIYALTIGGATRFSINTGLMASLASLSGGRHYSVSLQDLMTVPRHR